MQVINKIQQSAPQLKKTGKRSTPTRSVRIPTISNVFFRILRFRRDRYTGRRFSRFWDGRRSH